MIAFVFVRVQRNASLCCFLRGVAPSVYISALARPKYCVIVQFRVTKGHGFCQASFRFSVDIGSVFLFLFCSPSPLSSIAGRTGMRCEGRGAAVQASKHCAAKADQS